MASRGDRGYPCGIVAPGSHVDLSYRTTSRRTCVAECESDGEHAFDFVLGAVMDGIMRICVP